MTNPTQPIEHYTLSQAVQIVDAQRKKGCQLFMNDIHALLNDCCNELIGEPVAWQRRLKFDSSNMNRPGRWSECSADEAKDIFKRQPGYEYQPLYTLKKPQQETVSRVTAKISEEIKP